MNRKILSFLAVASIFIFSSCSVLKSSSHQKNGAVTVAPEIISYNELTMDLDPVGVTYTIDTTTEEGRLKLNKISIKEAEQLALVECLMKYNCATLFNPQFTHLKKGKDVLRVTVFGFPARYKRVNTETIETKKEDKKEDNQGNVTKRTITKSTNDPSERPTQKPRPKQKKRR